MEDLGDKRLSRERRVKGRSQVGSACILTSCVNIKQCKGIYTQDMWDNEDNCPHYQTEENRKSKDRRDNNNE